jgi:hypothetical protein
VKKKGVIAIQRKTPIGYPKPHTVQIINAFPKYAINSFTQKKRQVLSLPFF